MTLGAYTGWGLAEMATAAFAAAPHALGGLWLRSAPGPVRELLLELLIEFRAGERPNRIPLHTQEARLLGGIDLSRTLATGDLCWETGILEQTHGGIVALAMAERVDRRVVAHLCSSLDTGTIRVARDGQSRVAASELGVLALDEGLPEEAPPAALTERLGLRVDLDGIDIHSVAPSTFAQGDIARASTHWSQVQHPDEHVATLAGVALSLGIQSPRAVLLASRTARVLAALDMRDETQTEDLQRAVLLSLSHRATQVPQLGDENAEPEEPAAEPPAQEDTPEDETDRQTAGEVPLESLIEAAVARLPADLLSSLRERQRRQAKSRGSGKSGAQQRHRHRDRP